MTQALAAQQASSNQTGIMNTATSRQAQEVQAAIVIAKNFPRDEVAARFKIEKACKRQGLAEVAIYEYPKGNTKVEGPSIRLAETIAQSWGNIDFGIVELDQTDEASSIMVYAWDLESNTRQMKTFTVPHARDVRGGSKKLTSARDIYEITANMGARRLRACILGVIPNDVVEEAMTTCNNTLTGGSEDGRVDPNRVAAMLEKFAKIEVTEEMIVTRIGHNVSSLTASELVKLGNVYRSISDGMGGVDDFFKPAVKQQDPEAAAAEQLRVAIQAAKDAGVPDEFIDEGSMLASEVYEMIKAHKEEEATEPPVEAETTEEAPKTTPEKTAAKVANKEAITTTLERVASKMDQAKLVEQVEAMFAEGSAVSKAAYLKATGFTQKTDLNTADIGKLRRMFVMMMAEKQNTASQTKDDGGFA